MKLTSLFLVAALTLVGVFAVVMAHKAPAAHADGPPPVGPNGNGLGEEPWFTTFDQRLTDRAHLHVNVGNGNLVGHVTLLSIRGTGLDLTLEAHYNSLASGAASDLGQGWVFNLGPDTHLVFNGDGSVTYYGPEGYAAQYTATSGGGFNDAPGLNATLVKNGDGTYTLTFHKTSEKYTFRADGRLSTDQDKNGNTLTLGYNGSNQVTSLTDTQGRVTSVGYDESGRITTLTDPTDRTVLVGYDGGNHLTSITDPNNKTTTFAYSGSDLTTVTDPLTDSTSIGYDTSHRVTELMDATTAATGFAYATGASACGQGTTSNTVTDANSHTTTYCVDTQSRVSKTIDALGHTRSTTYSPNNDVTQLQDALTNTSAFTFDVNNNLTSATEANGTKTSFAYNDSTHPYFPSSTTDPAGNTLAYTYDAPGNLTATQDGLASQNTVRHTYNSNGTVATETDAFGHQTTFGYDAKGNLTSVTPPSPLGQTTLTHDSLSRVTSVTDGKNQKTSYTYDNDDRILTVTYNDNATLVYTYDANGNVVEVSDNTGVTTFTYDKVNELTTKKLPDGTQLALTYDPVGNVLTMRNGAAPTTTYGYNAVNLLTSLTYGDTGTTTYGYDANNRRTSVNLPNGVVVTISYDSAGHETGVVAKKGSTTLTSFTYTYIKPGTSTQTDLRYTMTNTAGQTTTYSYDALNRLTGASGNGSYSYAYDGVGNRTSATINGVATSYAYNAANELTSRTSGGNTTAYTYDANGNETGNSAGLTLEYNAKNQATAITGLSPLVYSGPDQTERTQAGSMTYHNAPNGVVSQTDSSGQTVYIREPNGALNAEQVSSGGLYYYLFDGLGSVVGLTDSSGNLVGSYAYDPYGNLTSSSGDVANGNPWRFASGYFDGATGLYHFGARYYDPTLGRWTQQDPIGGSLFSPGTLDRYVYANDDPVNLRDISGRISSACGFAIGGSLVDVLAAATIGEFAIPLSLGIAAAGLTASLVADQSPLSFAFGFGGLAGGILSAAFSATNIGLLFDAAGLITACAP